MFGDNKDYAFFVIVLCFAIVISVIFHVFFTPKEQAAFSEIYFPSPDGLPNYIDRDKDYNFSFTVRNLEGKPLTYSYDAKIELFNLYDVSEGLYNCVSSQRKKAQFEWAEGNESFKKIYLFEPKEGSSFFIYSKTDDYGYIDWPSYNFEYSYKNVLGQGSFTTTFYDNDTLKYSITVDDDNSEIGLSYIENGKISSIKKKIELKADNDVRINSTESLKYYLNDKLIFDEPIANSTKGMFGFRADGSYVLMRQLIAYRESRIEVTQSKNIRNFEANNNLVFQKLDKLRQESEDVAYLTRKAANFTAICNIGNCRQLNEFLAFPDDTKNLRLDSSIKNPNFLMGMFNLSSISFPDNAILQNSTSKALFWPSYSFRMEFQTFTQGHTFMLSFDNDLIVLFHDSSVYIINNGLRSPTIDRIENKAEVGINEFSIDSKDNEITLNLNRFPIYTMHKELPFGEVSIYTRNTFIIFSDMVMSNSDPGCSSQYISKNCNRYYRISSERQITGDRQATTVAQAVYVPIALSVSPFLPGADISSMAQEGNETLNGTADASQLLKKSIEYEIEIDPSLINSNIPSEKYAFNGRNGVLADRTNYSFSFDFVILEGAGLIEVSFYDTKGTELSKFVLYQPENKAYLFRNFQGSVLKDTFYVNLSKEDSHKFVSSYKNGESSYKIDNSKPFESRGLNMSNGYFSISTYNTYVDFTNIGLFDESIRRRIPFSITSDPCSLRKIDEMPIGKGSLYLGNNESESKTIDIAVMKDFDYGKVSVNLFKESMNSSEIHFWVVNND